MIAMIKGYTGFTRREGTPGPPACGWISSGRCCVVMMVLVLHCSVLLAFRRLFFCLIEIAIAKLVRFFVVLSFFVALHTLNIYRFIPF